MRIGLIEPAGKICQMRVAKILGASRAELTAAMDTNEVRDRAHMRGPLCLAAFAAGLHVLSENPLAHMVEASRRILDAAKAAGRHLGTGCNTRYYRAVAYVKEAMDAGKIGEIDHVRILAIPYVMILTSSRTLGEFRGYITKEP